MDSQKLQQINVELETLNQLKDEIHPGIIDIVKRSNLIKVVEMHSDLVDAENEIKLTGRFLGEPIVSVEAVVTVCWMDEDGNRFCKQVQV